MIIKSILPVLAVLSFVDNCVVHAVERNLAPKSSKSDGKASKKESEHSEVSAKAFKSDGKAYKMAKSKAGESFDAKAEKIGSKAAKSGDLFSKAAKASPGNAEPMTLTIMHMNDHHSHMDEEDKKIDVTNLNFSNGFTAEDNEIKVYYGGFPRIVSLFEMLSQEAKDEGHEVVKVHAGDAITGTSYYSLFGGEVDAKMMNQICFDAFALGNHEFDGGDAELAHFIEQLQTSDTGCTTPVLAANVVPHSESPLSKLQEDGSFVPHTIKELSNGEQVGIIGIDIASKVMESSFPDEGTILLDEVETATSEVAKLKEQGINKIIIVSHIGYEYDLAWMAAIDGVDVVVGGDSHSLLGPSGGDNFDGPNTDGPYPTIKDTPNGAKICIVQAWEYAHGVGKLDVVFDKDGEVVSCNGDFIVPFDEARFKPQPDADNSALLARHIKETYPNLIAVNEDASTVTALEVFKAQTDELKAVVIATVPEDICLERVPGQGRSGICSRDDTSSQGGGVCNLVAKAFLEQALEADFAIQNAGGCRVDILSGDFTLNSALTLLPFQNELLIFRLTGAEIVAVLEEVAIHAFGNPDDSKEGLPFPYVGNTGAYPYASGIRYNVNAGAIPGEVITDVEINPRLENSEWIPIDLDTTYGVVANNYIGGGNDGYVTLGNIDRDLVTNTYLEYAQSFIDYAEAVTEAGGELLDVPLDEYSTKMFTVETEE